MRPRSITLHLDHADYVQSYEITWRTAGGVPNHVTQRGALQWAWEPHHALDEALLESCESCMCSPTYCNEAPLPCLPASEPPPLRGHDGIARQ